MGSTSIAWQLMDEGVPAPGSGQRWHQSYVHTLLRNTAYKGTWSYGQTRQVLTEQGRRVYDQPQDTWIQVPVPPLVDEETWDRVQVLKKQRLKRSKRNTREFYLLQHVLRCAECGLSFMAKANRYTSTRHKGKVYRYEYPTPLRYYICSGMQTHRLRCRRLPYIRAERLEERVWSEVKRVLQNPDLIVTGIEALDGRESGGLEEEITQAERVLRSVQMEEDRAIRLFVSGKITEEQLDLQRKFITERLESLRAKLDDYRAREASGAEKRALMEAVLAWAGEVGEGLDELAPEQRRDVLQLVVEQVMIDRDNNMNVTLAIPVDDSVAVASSSSRFASNILTESSITELVKVVDEEMDGVAREQRKRLQTVEDELEDVKRKLGRIWHVIETTDIDIADAAGRIKEHRDRQERLEDAAAEARAILADRRAVLDDVETITAYAKDMRDFLNESELTERRAFIESFVKEIVVMPGDALMRYTVPMPDDSLIPGRAAEKVALNGSVLSTVKNGGPKRTELSLSQK